MKTDDTRTIVPSVDVFENDAEILLVADVPGVNAESLSVRLEDGSLSLVGRFGDIEYRRSFSVPESVDPEQVSATVKAGIAHIKLPKAEKYQPRLIPVTAA